MEPWVNQLLVCSAVIAMFIVVWFVCMSSNPKMKSEINLSAETPEQKELKVYYELGFLCGKCDGDKFIYNMPIYGCKNRLHWLNGYHDGLKWRAEEKKLNGDFTE